jgi:predicted secreted Zn-dependent protease
VDDDDFSRDMIKAILLLCYSRKLALTVSAAEAGIVQAVYDHWSIGGKGAAELRHLREDGRDGVS